MIAQADPDIVPLADAAALYDVCYDTALRLAKTGEFPGAIKVGGRWKVSLPRFRHLVHGAPLPEAVS